MTTAALPKPYRSFQAQFLHYFQRDHEAVRREPIEGPAAWKGSELANDRSWRVTLDGAQLSELDRAVREVRGRGLDLGQLHREDFALPTLGPVIADWRRHLVRGRGFLLVRGLPVRAWGDDDAALAYWGLGLHLGQPGAQNPAEELLGHVVDTGEAATNPNIRRYRTSGAIAFHCDPADVVGLLCLRTARAGGASRLVSSVSVYNELLERRPDLADRLYEPFLLDGRDEQSGKARATPVPPCRYAGGQLRTFYHSDYFRSARRHPDVPAFTHEEQTLLDLYEEIANSPRLRLDMRLEVGDLQIVSNHTVLHARAAYQDEPGEGRERHLLRLWLSLDHEDAA